MKKYNILILVSLLVISFGCAHFPLNEKIESYDKNRGYHFKNLVSPYNSDSLFVILSFSGGGTRAAALSYGVLEKLRDSEIIVEGKKRSLLDEVDVISSVSGGSFTAAYYALFGERLFSDFEHVFLKKNIEGELTGLLFSPVNWFRLASPSFDRIDMAAEYYDKHIFESGTFGDLVKKGNRPFILINATDMSLGAQFTFTQAQFDPLCSDLSAYPIARAVAASSAFPILLSPITIKNYAGTCHYEEPVWIKNALADRDVSKARFSRALRARSYENSKKRRYIHLLDGGIADNIGLRGPIDSLSSTDGPWSIMRMINMENIKKVAFIVVNAKTDPSLKYDRKQNAPKLKDVVMTVATVPMDNYSTDTIELLTASIKELERDARSRKACQKLLRNKCPDAKLPGGELAEVDFYPVVISFDSIKDKKERSFFKELPTNFSLPPKTIDKLRDVAAKLLERSTEFSRLLKDLENEQ